MKLAFATGINRVSVHQVTSYTATQDKSELDVVEIEASTPIAREFTQSLMISPYYDATTFSLSLEEPTSLFTYQSPKQITNPVVLPAADVYEQLWQFTNVTFSLLGRVFLSSVLLAYGMVEGLMPVLIAGLLFLPYHHHMLCVGLGVVIRERRFLMQGLLAMLLSTFLIFMAGASVGFFTNPPIDYQEFGSPLEGFVLSIVIGVAAAMAATDDAGRRELIGLAATAHISVHPAFIGLSIIFGYENGTRVWDHLLLFGINTATLTLAAAITFAVLRMRGDGIRRLTNMSTDSTE